MTGTSIKRSMPPGVDIRYRIDHGHLHRTQFGGRHVGWRPELLRYCHGLTRFPGRNRPGRRRPRMAGYPYQAWAARLGVAPRCARPGRRAALLQARSRPLPAAGGQALRPLRGFAGPEEAFHVLGDGRQPRSERVPLSRWSLMRTGDRLSGFVPCQIGGVEGFPSSGMQRVLAPIIGELRSD